MNSRPITAFHWKALNQSQLFLLCYLEVLALVHVELSLDELVAGRVKVVNNAVNAVSIDDLKR